MKMAEAETQTPAETERPAHPKLVLTVVGVGTLLSAMAGSAVSLTLPDIGRDFDIMLGQTSWVVLSYLLAITVLLLVFGYLGDQWGHRRIYLTGFSVFGVASLVCGLAPAFWVLVSGRVLQGIAASMVMASAPALLTTSFPARQRGQALGIMSTSTYLGLTIGPPLGGLLISAGSWHWVFLMNVPVAILVFSLGVRYLPLSARGRPGSFDVLGTVLLASGLPLLLLALALGGQWGWTSWQTLAAAVLGLVFLAAFVRVETIREQPLIRLGLFRSRAFTGATLSAFCNYVSLFVSAILLPFYLMEGKGMPASQAGLLLAIQSLVMALTAAPAGWISDRIGSRGLAVTGLLILTAGLGGISTVGPLTTPIMVAAWLAIMGLGIGVFITPNSSALMGAAPGREQGVAGGVMALARNLGMMIGAATATVVFHAAGGQTGVEWSTGEYNALHVSLLMAAGVSLLGVICSAVMGRVKV